MLDRSAVEFSGGVTASTTATTPKSAPASIQSPRAAPAVPVKKAAPSPPVYAPLTINLISPFFCLDVKSNDEYTNMMTNSRAGGLPPNWSMQKNEEGHPYWWNSVTGESTWTKPTA
jgi:hypothetical protein